MPEEKQATPRHPIRWLATLLVILVIGGFVLAMVWKDRPVTPAASSPAASQPKHNANPAPKSTP